MNKIYNRIKLLCWSSMTLCTVFACSNQTEADEITEGPQVNIISIGVRDRAVEGEIVLPNDGDYYLVYDSKKGNGQVLPISITEGTLSQFGKTDILWTDLSKENKNNGFILSNSQTISDEQEAQKDIVWGQIKPANSPELSFLLTHRMAQVEVIVNLPENWSIETMTLKNLKSGYTYQLDKGEITATGIVKNIPVTKGADRRYALLLPPQEKADNSELSVQVKKADGTSGTYHRLLPYAMREEISAGQWKDIPLAFRAARLLQLNATITNEETDEIYFTYATLTDWEKIDLGTISVRPEGVYTMSDLKNLIAVWNKTPKDEIRLNRYGTPNNNKWTFILRANITIPNGNTVGRFTNVNETNFYFDIAPTHDYKITGVEATDLGLADNKTYNAELFAKTNP